MKKNSDVKLYNILLPIWLLWLAPITWLVILPGNFIIDLLVIVVTMKALRLEHVKENAKKSILYVWIFGFLADFIGVAAMLIGSMVEPSGGVVFNPFESILSFLWVTGCVILSGVCIYFFNKKICLRKTELSDVEKKKLALSLAVFTAPYLFYLPSTLLYG